MTLLTLSIALASFAALVALIWLLGKPLPAEDALNLEGCVEELAPMHSQRFPQLRQSLEAGDRLYVQRKLSPKEERKWRAERRDIVRAFLSGLGEDFARLDHLARTVASLSPAVSRRQEIERLWLSVRFRIHYRIADNRITLGELNPARQLARLTELLGNMAAQTEAAMAHLQEASDRRAGANFGA